jgi:uncharacterized protein YceK
MRALALVLLAALAGCAGVPVNRQPAESPCAQGNEATWACQVERYHNVSQ